MPRTAATNRVDRVSRSTCLQGTHVALVGRRTQRQGRRCRICSRASSFRPAAGSPWRATNFADSASVASPDGASRSRPRTRTCSPGSLSHNLLLRPHAPAVAAGDATTRQRRRREETRVRDALIAGNSTDDIRADWIDYEAAGVAECRGARRNGARGAAARGDGAGDHRVRPCERGGSADRSRRWRRWCSRPGRASAIACEKEDLASLVELFDPHALPLEHQRRARTSLFGTPRSPAFQPANLPANPEFVALLRDVGLLDDLDAAGIKVAGLMVELFADVAPDSDLFDQYSIHQRRTTCPNSGSCWRRSTTARSRATSARGTGAAPGADVPGRRRAASAGRDRRTDAAQDRRGAR